MVVILENCMVSIEKHPWRARVHRYELRLTWDWVRSKPPTPDWTTAAAAGGRTATKTPARGGARRRSRQRCSETGSGARFSTRFAPTRSCGQGKLNRGAKEVARAIVAMPHPTRQTA